MTVNTRRVTGRRKLRFESLGEVLTDAEHLASGPHRQLGNWSLGACANHLAIVMEDSIDGAPFRVSWPWRIVARLLKPRMLRGPMQPGFRLRGQAAKRMLPEENLDLEQGLTRLRRAIDRFERETRRAPHAFFGPMSDAEWRTLHCRHAELHLSFFTPGK